MLRGAEPLGGAHEVASQRDWGPAERTPGAGRGSRRTRRRREAWAGQSERQRVGQTEGRLVPGSRLAKGEEVGRLGSRGAS